MGLILATKSYLTNLLTYPHLLRVLIVLILEFQTAHIILT